MAFRDLLMERDAENVVIFDTVRHEDGLRDHAHRLIVIFGFALRLVRSGLTEASVHCDGTILGSETTVSVLALAVPHAAACRGMPRGAAAWSTCRGAAGGLRHCRGSTLIKSINQSQMRIKHSNWHACTPIRLIHPNTQSNQTSVLSL